MNQDFYIHRGVAYIPVLAKTEAGFYLQVDPVAIVNVEDSQGLRSALVLAFAYGNPLITTPSPDALPKADLHKRAGVRSWSQFEKEAAYWSAYDENGVYKFGPWKRHKSRGWVPDPDRAVTLATGASIDDLAKHIVKSVQESVAKEN